MTKVPRIATQGERRCIPLVCLVGNLFDMGFDLGQPVGRGEADDELGELGIFNFNFGGRFSTESRSLAFDFFLE